MEPVNRQRQLELRKNLWPEATDEWLWSRHTHDGFTSLPKGMPLILSLMDDLSKGQPISSTYLELRRAASGADVAEPSRHCAQ